MGVFTWSKIGGWNFYIVLCSYHHLETAFLCVVIFYGGRGLLIDVTQKKQTVDGGHRGIDFAGDGKRRGYVHDRFTVTRLMKKTERIQEAAPVCFWREEEGGGERGEWDGG